MVEEYVNVYSLMVDETCMRRRRPWGHYEVLSGRPDHKVKRIVVYPGKRLSLQSHARRSEQWTVISGSLIVTRNDEEIRLNPGDSIGIPVGVRHRAANPGEEPAVFIEVQTGDYFGEDDIQRFDDDFDRGGTGPPSPEEE